MRRFCLALLGFGVLTAFANGQPMYCPKPSKLFKAPGTMYWGTYGGWRSYRRSFAATLNEFLGAQWDGVGRGKVICLYANLGSHTFPVTVNFNKTTFQPSGGKWGTLNSGHVNCVARNIKACPFVVVPKPKKKDIYQILNSFKTHPRAQLQAF